MIAGWLAKRTDYPRRIAVESSMSAPALRASLRRRCNERPTMSSTTLAARRDRALGAGAPLFYDAPLHIVRGEGVELFDADGRRYVDMYNNVPCVGHANPHVVEAMARQQGTLNVHSRYLHEGIVAFAERLAALHGPAIESVVFSCSGTEANEVALRMARLATGKSGIVCTNATYHGNSEAVAKLNRIGDIRNSTGNVRAIPFPEMLRPLVPGANEDDLTEAYLDRLRGAIRSLEDDGVGFAGLIVCSIFANEGLPDVPRGFMPRAAEIVRAAGGLLISDEVQAGYGRTGRWWGYDVTGFTPDIVVTGKPMGNGLPLAATAASRSLVEGFRSATRYFNTFASSPLQAAVGMAVIDVIERDGLLENVATVGAFLKSALAERKGRFASIADVRGHGLFVGVEIAKTDAARTPDTDRAVEVINRLKDKGFLTSNAGAFRNVVKIRPPLPFAQHHAEEFLVAFDATMAELDG
jgi:4-aminobutyrate aminotransferase-like enzyme